MRSPAGRAGLRTHMQGGYMPCISGRAGLRTPRGAIGVDTLEEGGNVLLFDLGPRGGGQRAPL